MVEQREPEKDGITAPEEALVVEAELL